MKSNHKPWITSEIKVIMNAKDRSYMKKNHPQFMAMRELLTKKIYNAKQSYSRKKFYQNEPVKRKWATIKSIIGRTKGNDNIDDCLANKLNQQFADVFNSADILPNINCTDDNEGIKPIIEPSLVFYYLKHITSNAIGEDGIPGKIYREFAVEFAESLCYIFNMCVQNCSIPLLWKSANESLYLNQSPNIVQYLFYTRPQKFWKKF